MQTSICKPTPDPFNFPLERCGLLCRRVNVEEVYRFRRILHSIITSAGSQTGHLRQDTANTNGSGSTFPPGSIASER